MLHIDDNSVKRRKTINRYNNRNSNEKKQLSRFCRVHWVNDKTRGQSRHRENDTWKDALKNKVTSTSLIPFSRRTERDDWLKKATTRRRRQNIEDVLYICKNCLTNIYGVLGRISEKKQPGSNNLVPPVTVLFIFCTQYIDYSRDGHVTQSLLQFSWAFM